MNLFYSPEITTHPVLPKDEASHCIRALRLREGDVIDLTDGKGTFYRAEIQKADPSDCRLKILEAITPEKPYIPIIEIAVAPTKNADRTEWFVEKAVETGIDKISLLNCRFSERREMKTDRLRRVMISAMKQSLKSYLPVLQEIMPFDDFIRQPFEGQKFIAHCHDSEKHLLVELYKPFENVLILVGPEGDFSEDEVQAAINQGFEPVSLGESRLRTETAALMALNTVQIACLARVSN